MDYEKEKSIGERYTTARKQKLRFMFGITEKQLKTYFKKASMKKGNTALYLSQYLERRLDNIIFHLGFAPTRAAARQLVNHGHIAINKKKVSIASYQLRVGEEVSFADEKATKIPYIESSIGNKDIILPIWLEKSHCWKVDHGPNSRGD